MQSFGTNYEDVKTFLDGQKVAQSTYNDNQISIWTSSYQVMYHFRQDRLYKMEVSRDYGDRKAYRTGIQSLKNNYLQQGLEVFDLSTEKDEVAFVVRKGNELHEIYQIPLGRNNFQIKQMRLDMDGCTSEEKVALRQDQHFASLLSE